MNHEEAVPPAEMVRSARKETAVQRPQRERECDGNGDRDLSPKRTPKQYQSTQTKSKTHRREKAETKEEGSSLSDTVHPIRVRGLAGLKIRIQIGRKGHCAWRENASVSTAFGHEGPATCAMRVFLTPHQRKGGCDEGASSAEGGGAERCPTEIKTREEKGEGGERDRKPRTSLRFNPAQLKRKAGSCFVSEGEEPA